MRDDIRINDRVRTNATDERGVVQEIRYTVRLDDKPELGVYFASEVHRVVPIEEVTTEAIEQSAQAQAAIERAQAMIALAPTDRTELLGVLGELARELLSLVPILAGGTAQRIASVATKLAALVENEAAR